MHATAERRIDAHVVALRILHEEDPPALRSSGLGHRRDEHRDDREAENDPGSLLPLTFLRCSLSSVAAG